MNAMHTVKAKALLVGLKEALPNVKVKVLDNGYRFNIKEITTETFKVLKDADEMYDVSIKRSGLGLSVFILVY